VGGVTSSPRPLLVGGWLSPSRQSRISPTSRLLSYETHPIVAMLCCARQTLQWLCGGWRLLVFVVRELGTCLDIATARWLALVVSLEGWWLKGLVTTR